jgi:hypothetical protein
MTHEQALELARNLRWEGHRVLYIDSAVEAVADALMFAYKSGYDNGFFDADQDAEVYGK